MDVLANEIRRGDAIAFRTKIGYWPFGFDVGRWYMREVVVDGQPGFGVGCQIHSFDAWRRKFGHIARRFGATVHETEIAWALINLARERAGVKVVRRRAK